jgi:hypothetical protein
MSNIIRIDKFKKQQRKKKNKANTLCKSGFHQWELIHKEQFDVKQGKLITTYRCKYCQALKTSAK